jgi:hypothetical protein
MRKLTYELKNATSQTVQSSFSEDFNFFLKMHQSEPQDQELKLFKGTVSRDFLLLVFYESVSPQPQSIPLRPFQIFSKIRGDIRKSRCTAGVNDTGGKFATSSPCAVDTGGKFATGVNDAGGKLPPVTTTPAANLPPVSLTPVANNENNIRLLDTLK